MTTVTGADSEERGAPPRVAMFAALEVRHYPALLLSGWLWNMCRWASGFLGAFVVNRLTHSARLVQLTGVSLWAPLLIGGVVGGMISDRFERRRTVIVQFVVLIPLAAAMGVAAITDQLRLAMVYPFLVIVGIGWVFDMTSRRAIVYDLVGPGRLDNAMALESLSSASGLAIGTLVGGTAIQAVGVGAAYLCMAGLAAVALLCFLRVPPVSRTVVRNAEPPLRAWLAGFRLLRTERALVSVLAITAAVNFFYFSFSPLVQVVAGDLGVGAFLTGLLAAMLGVGMMCGSATVARQQPHRRGLVYVCGAAVAMVVLTGFALSPFYAGSMVCLLVSATGMGLFGSTQGTLTMTAVEPELRGRALGLLSTAIGTLPLGMISLGELAELIGARWAIVTSAGCGLAVLGLSLLWRPDVLQQRS